MRYARTPTELRRQGAGTAPAGSYRLRLSYRPPYDWEAILAFLAARATPGVERIFGSTYRRTIAIDGAVGTLAVSRPPRAPYLRLEVAFPEPRTLIVIVERVRRLFDLDADPGPVSEHLRTDPLLHGVVRAHPGLSIVG